MIAFDSVPAIHMVADSCGPAGYNQEEASDILGRAMTVLLDDKAKAFVKAILAEQGTNSEPDPRPEDKVTIHQHPKGFFILGYRNGCVVAGILVDEEKLTRILVRYRGTRV